jgi:hypothetical protein
MAMQTIEEPWGRGAMARRTEACHARADGFDSRKRGHDAAGEFRTLRIRGDQLNA